MAGGYRNLTTLPKAHLHCHFLGSARAETIKEMARDQGLEVPDLSNFTDVGSFVGHYVAAEKVIQRPEHVQRICREIVEDAAAEGVRYIEQSFNPNTYAHRFGMTATELFDLMDRTFQEAGRRHGVTVRYMVTVNRGIDPRYLIEAAQFAVAHRSRHVVAFGYGGDESLGDAMMAEACAIARAGGLFISPHAWEAKHAQRVQEVLSLKPRRIAHGVGAAASRSLLRRLAVRGIVCDVCPMSNVRMGVFDRVEDVPIPEFIAAKVPFTINADDELFFGASILDNYELLRSVFKLSDAQIADVARTSFRASGAPDTVIGNAVADIDSWLHQVDRGAVGVA